MTTNPWDYIGAISYSKKDIIKEADIPDLEEKDYNAFIVNRGLSYFIDTIMYANEMNQFTSLDNKLQFDYLLNAIRPKKRFSKWAKKDISTDLQFIIDYYKYNVQKARIALSILNKNDLETLKRKCEKGGVNE